MSSFLVDGRAEMMSLCTKGIVIRQRAVSKCNVPRNDRDAFYRDPPLKRCLSRARTRDPNAQQDHLRPCLPWRRAL